MPLLGRHPQKGSRGQKPKAKDKLHRDAADADAAEREALAREAEAAARQAAAQAEGRRLPWAKQELATRAMDATDD